jgi:hypothetical protein
MLVASLAGVALAFATPTHETLGPFESPGVIDCGIYQDNCVDFFNGTQTTFATATATPSDSCSTSNTTRHRFVQAPAADEDKLRELAERWAPRFR